MAYFLDLFSPETYEAFTRSDRTVSGFRRRHLPSAERVRPGDKFIGYLTRLSRWVGVLEVLEGPYEDGTPRFVSGNDPYVVRFRVRPIAWLPVEKAIPIHEDRIWNALSFTRGHPKHSRGWASRLRRSLVALSEEDGAILESAILAQSSGGITYPYDEDEYRKFFAYRVLRVDGDVSVSVPEETEESAPALSLTHFHIPSTSANNKGEGPSPKTKR